MTRTKIEVAITGATHGHGMLFIHVTGSTDVNSNLYYFYWCGRLVGHQPLIV